MTASLGPDFFFDAAAIGGGDHNSTNLVRDIGGFWTAGASVTLRGLGWASPSTGTTATQATVTFTDPGPDLAFGTADDAVVGTVTDSLVFTGAAGEFVWDFNSDIVFTAASSSLRIQITSNANIRRKTTTTADTSAAAVKLSLAGVAGGGGAPPAIQTAGGSGFWETLTWNHGGGTTTGGVGAADTALIGSHRQVTYRGLPADESFQHLHLGDSSTATGQGTLRISSGTLTVTGDVHAGRNAAANDAFLFVDAGALHIGGNASFGRSSPSCDGSLIIGSGAVTVGGNLAMGGFEQGGSMLRFHNPGSAPPLGIGGALILGRCSLDLTFDATYSHVPGTVIPLANFSSRSGQFLNFRQGEEFNCGPHRFRIQYTPSSVSLTALPPWSAPAVRPNIILLFADDGGYADLGIQGNPKFPTPALGTIASSGVRFTDHYMTGGVCHPSRCGLLSGIYQQRFGSENNLSGDSHNGMAVDVPTIPGRLQGLGYRTYGIGKWHLGDTVEFHPNCRGFHRWYGLIGGSRSYYDAGSTENTVFQDQMTPDFAAEDSAYVTDRIGDKAVAFINEHLASPQAADPFFLYVSFTAIHAPMDIRTTDPRFARLSSEFGLTAADYQNSSPVFGGSNQSTVDANRYELAAMTLALDENVGKILARLESAGIDENTLIVYTNDNGGAGWNASAGGNFSYNSPLRGYKGGSMNEGSIRVPAVAAWPGTIPAGQVITSPALALDWGATFVNAGGASPAAARQGLEGLDLMPLMRDGTPLPADRALFWRSGGNSSGGSAVRMGNWKMLITDPGGAPRLYQLRNDIGENTNLAASQPAVLADLMARFQSWESRVIPPLYGNADTLVDTGLEYHALTSGLRLTKSGAAPAWISAPLRSALPLDRDFSFSFLLRATEPGPHPASAGLWAGLGDSSARASFIRAGIDFQNGNLVLAEGKSGLSSSAPLPAPPVSGFATARLDFQASTRLLSLLLDGVRVSISLPASYVSLTHSAMGVAAMEGEITPLRPLVPGVDPGQATSAIESLSAPLSIRLDLGMEAPFVPRLERADDLADFTEDPTALVEALGGGQYRVSIASPASDKEFFRFRTDVP